MGIKKVVGILQLLGAQTAVFNTIGAIGNAIIDAYLSSKRMNTLKDGNTTQCKGSYEETFF